jgi:putative membrane protein
MWYVHDGMTWRVVLGGVWTLLFFGGLITLIVWLVSHSSRRSHDEPRGPEKQDALEIAKLRYARGEITKEQFDQIKRDLTAP